MTLIRTNAPVNFDKNQSRLSALLPDGDLPKPLININYINAEEIAVSNKSKPKPEEDITKNYSAKRLKNNRKKTSVFSLSNTGIALTTFGVLDFFSAKQYLSGSLLFGGGLLAYAIGQSFENRK
jgi:hypothetical protein